jgi:hypothetical protein
MNFDRINFNHFFLEVKNIMDPKWFRYINPEIQTYWKSHSVYFALEGNGTEVYLCMMQGKDKDNIQGMRELIKYLKINGVKTLRFATYAKNRRMLVLFKYIEANYTKTISKYYEDGDDLVEYVLELSKSKRFT